MKRLIVCCDGTWQKLTSPYPTNVAKIAQAITTTGADGAPQLVFYDEGVGTGDWRDRLKGGAFGIGLDQNIQDGYRFLCLNYEGGDEIYLFGFSRGSYTVRSLAGFVSRFGLMARKYIRETPKAYKYYRLSDSEYQQKRQEVDKFREDFSVPVPITLLGCWDTVGSLGIPDLTPFIPIDKWVNRKYKFHDTILSERVKNALHGVAIDEIRETFGLTPMQRSAGDEQPLKQVWFPGEHGCVGGGTQANAGLSDRALIWMMDGIKNLGLGLTFDTENIVTGLSPDHKVNFDNTPKGVFKLGGLNIRKVDCEALDESVIARWADLSDYRPSNLDPCKAQLNNTSEG